MAVRNPVQIAQHAWSAGFRGTDLVRAVAVAMAESSGQDNVVNRIGATGLWQINQPVHVGDHPTWTIEWLKDPNNNARAAYTLFKERGWQPWDKSLAGQAIWTNTATASVATFLATNPTTIPKEAASLGGQAVSGATNAIPGVEGISQVVDAMNRVGQWVTTPKNILRIVYVVAGLALVNFGLVMAAMPMLPSAITKTPVGKIAKKVVA